MAEAPRKPDAAPEDMAQTLPGSGDLFRDADTRHMVHEISNSVSALAETVRSMDNRHDRDSRKLDELSRDNREVMNRLKEFGPKIDDVLGFIKHGVPNLATKADAESLKSEISHRPTRRQSITDIITFVTLIGVLLAVASHFAR